MGGETELAKLLGAMRPELRPGTFVFVTMALAERPPDGVEPLMIFKEKEGWTCIVGEEAARNAGLASTFRCRMITLAVHSSLEAVGFMAVVTTRLAAAGIGVNPVSGFYHDHLFAPADRAEEALAILRGFADARASAG